MRLSAAHLGALPESVARPGYDREERGIGIVHFGISAFHRAHMAAYTDDAMAADQGDWRILGVSLRSSAVRDQMRPQDGLYTLVERSAAGSKARIIGTIADVPLVASEERERLIARLCPHPPPISPALPSPKRRHCRTPDGSLDLALADDRSAYAYLAAAFARRKEAGLSGLTLLSCSLQSGGQWRATRTVDGRISVDQVLN